MVDSATVHWSVRKRFEEPAMLIYDEERPYRLELLRGHYDYASFYAPAAEAGGDTA